MSAHDSNAHRRPVFPQSPKRAGRGLAFALLAGFVGVSLLWSCGGNSGSGGGDFGSGNGGSAGNGNGGSSNGGSSNGGNANGGSSNGGSNGGSSGNVSSGSSGNVSSGSSGSGTSGSNVSGSSGNASSGSSGNVSSGSSGNASTGSSGNASTGSSGSSSGINDGGPDSTVAADSGPACTNTDMTSINIDSSGWACNNQWDIQGAWYCYVGGGTSDCTGEGDVPFKASSSAMCMSGTTGSPPSATAYGAGIGLNLGQAAHDAGKGVFNANSANGHKVVGFAITISGDTGGSVLRVNFPSPTATAESPAVIVPGVSSGSSPVTYNVLLSDAFITDSATFPPKLDVTNIGSVEVQIPADQIPFTYNYCVTKIVPIMAPVVPATFGNYGPAFKNETQFVVEGFGPYGIQNDPTAANAMSVQASYGGGQVGFSATPSFNTGGVGAFPSIVYGWVHGGSFIGSNDTGGYAGGKTIGALAGKTVPSSWSFTPSGGGKWDAAYDTWFAANQSPINAGVELMVWLDESGVQPIGSAVSGATVSEGGGSFAVWTGNVSDSNGSHPVISYLRSASTTSVTGLNLNTFFQDATSRNVSLSSGSYLLGIQAGFELYGSGTSTTSSYSVSVPQ